MGDMGDYGDEFADRASGFMDGIHPSIRAAVLMWLLLVGLGIVHLFTAGVSMVVCYPVQLLFYVGNGVLAGYLALQSTYEESELPKVGALAGLVAWILPALFYLVFGLILGMVTLGIGFMGIAAWLICGPIDLAIQASCGALGGWLYGKMNGANASTF